MVTNLVGLNHYYISSARIEVSAILARLRLASLADQSLSYGLCGDIVFTPHRTGRKEDVLKQKIWHFYRSVNRAFLQVSSTRAQGILRDLLKKAIVPAAKTDYGWALTTRVHRTRGPWGNEYENESNGLAWSKWNGYIVVFWKLLGFQRLVSPQSERYWFLKVGECWGLVEEQSQKLWGVSYGFGLT